MGIHVSNYVVAFDGRIACEALVSGNSNQVLIGEVLLWSKV